MAQIKHFQAAPGDIVSFGANDGTIHTLEADAEGVLSPKTSEEEQWLERHGYAPVKAKEQKPATKPGAKEA